MSITQKYLPKTLSQVVGNEKTIDYIIGWLNTFEDVKAFLNKNNLLKKSSKGRKKKLVGMTDEEIEYSKRKGNLLINGPHGSGKTTIVNIVLNMLDYEILNLNILDGKIKIDREVISKLSKYNKVNENKKIVLVIDELESIITLNEKNTIFDIIKDNNFNRWMPIIIITNNKHNKQLNEVKKISNDGKIYIPYDYEIEKWLKTIIEKENINLEHGLLRKFIEYCQKDMRKILILLDELKMHYKDTMIYDEMLNNFEEIMKKKDQDFDLFKSTELLLTNYINVENSLELYETQKTLIPLMIHENYYKFVKKENYFDVLDNISNGDIMDNYIFGEQQWDLAEIYGLFSCTIPSYYVNKYSNGKKIVYRNEIMFASDLNRTSVTKMNTKNINKTNENILKNSIVDETIETDDIAKSDVKKNTIHNKTIDEFIYMSEIYDGYIEEKQKKTKPDNIMKINKLKIIPKNKI